MAAAAVTITSFGFLHGDPPDATITLDLRVHYRDPHVDPALRNLTSRDEPVRLAVLGTAGVLDLVDATCAMVRALASGPAGTAPISIAVGCAGGRHRAPTVAMALALELELDVVDVHHRDLDKPVVCR